MSTNRLAIFDLDCTLIRGYLGPTPCPSCDGLGFHESPRPCKRCKGEGSILTELHPYSEVVLLPGRRAQIEALHEAGARLAIATNQGGVAFGHRTPEEAHQKIERAIDYLGVPRSAFHVEVCMHHPHASVEAQRLACECRKPKPGMLRWAMGAMLAMPEDTIYVGDLDTDKEAAEAAGVAFEWAEEYFGTESFSDLARKAA